MRDEFGSIKRRSIWSQRGSALWITVVVGAVVTVIAYFSSERAAKPQVTPQMKEVMSDRG